MATRKKSSLTDKQRRLIEFLTEYPDATLREAGIAAGYSTTNSIAASSAAKALNSPNVQRRMQQLMDRDPALQDRALLARLKDGLGSDKKTYASFNGQIMDERVDADMPTRKEYLKLALTVKGALVTKQEVTGNDGDPLTVKVVQFGAGDVLEGL